MEQPCCAATRGRSAPTLPIQRADIADYLGLTIETVSRTFSALKRRGLIALPRPDQVLLLRRKALEDLASGA